MFGWKIETDLKMNYTMWAPAEGVGGGFSPLGETVKPGNVLIHVDSDDIDATCSGSRRWAARFCLKRLKFPALAGSRFSKIRPEYTFALHQPESRTITSECNTHSGTRIIPKIPGTSNRYRVYA